MTFTDMVTVLVVGSLAGAVIYPVIGAIREGTPPAREGSGANGGRWLLGAIERARIVVELRIAR